MTSEDLEARLARVERTLLEVVTALGMLVGELAQREDLALEQPEFVERALEAGWETLFPAEGPRRTVAFELPREAAERNRLRELAPGALGRAMVETGAIVGAMYEVPRGASELALVASEGYPAAVMAEYLTIPLDADLPAAVVARTGHPLWFGDRSEILARYPHLAQAHATTETAVGIENAMGAVVPLTSEGNVVATLLVGFPPSGDVAVKLERLRERWSFA